MTRAKKSYGQHFLKDQGLCENIAQYILDLPDVDLILEIGPGTGALTRYLYKTEKEFRAIEADQDVFVQLHNNIPDLKEGVVFLSDFLRFDLEPLLKGKRVALVGNFPYNISTQIVFRLLDHQANITHMVGMFQKEVSDRIISPPGKKSYGILSVLTAAYYSGETIFNVPPTAFSPPPRVQSSVIHLKKLEDLPEIPNKKLFVRVVKAAFGNRRKMLRNSLKSLGYKDMDVSHELFTRRPEQMSLSDFIDMTKIIATYEF